jgi:uncharacterized membrane protein YraQ (UPF0718 family)
MVRARWSTAVFTLMMWITALSLPSIFMLRKTKAQAPAEHIEA